MSNERHMDLMAGAALGDLDAEELAELQALGATDAELAALERSIAAVAVASVTDRTMPDALRARIERATGLPPRLVAVPSPVAAPAPAAAPATAPAPAPAAPAPRRSVSAIVGWLAAAALLVLAGLGWLRPWVKAPPSAERARAELIATAPDAKVIAWTPTTDSAGASASGDVVWSDSKQMGYMRFHGLAQNDPKVTQYQLWIFDPAQDAKYPVDGGVFDVTNGDVIVPIHAKLHVEQPTLFAVTVERSGGVVVSKRDRIVATATASR